MMTTMATTKIDKKTATASQYYQQVLDTLAPYSLARWCIAAFLFLAFAVRVYMRGVSLSHCYPFLCSITDYIPLGFLPDHLPIEYPLPLPVRRLSRPEGGP